MAPGKKNKTNPCLPGGLLHFTWDKIYPLEKFLISIEDQM